MHLLPDTHDSRFLLPERVPKQYIDIIVSYFGVRQEDIIFYNDLSEVVHVSRLIAPSMLWVHPLVSPKMNSFINDLIFDVCGPNPSKRVDLPERFVISRERFRPLNPTAGHRLMDNPDEIWRIAEDFGLAVLHPETLQWHDQVHLFHNARLIVGETGSGLHNAMFSGDNTTIIALGNSGSNLIQSSIAALREQRIGYIFPTVESTLPGGCLSFSYDPNHFARRLDEMLSLI